MAQFLAAVWNAVLPGWRDLLLPTLVAAPFLIWAGALQIHWYRNRDVAPPQQEKLLRPPGYSLQQRMDDLFGSLVWNLLLSVIMFVIAGAAAMTSGMLSGAGAPTPFTLFYSILILVAFVPGTALMLRAWKNTLGLLNTRLGLRGEQAVAEVLHELGDCGYRAFHDLQPDGKWNIDHVIVGPRGVYLIETKTRSRKPGKGEQPRHVVIYDGQHLVFPSGVDRRAVPQAQRNAGWLTDFLSKKTCELVSVEPIIVVPGWYTESKGNFPVKLMNTNYLKSYLRKQPEKIDPNQARRIIAALDEQCRTLEF